MNFYIRQIELWFKKNVAPKVYEFEPNKINVITGDSSTGKSSILRIIDYCLLTERSTIVEDVINQNVKWYGLAFSLNDVDYVIARKNPQDETAEQQMFFSESSEFPDKLQVNTTRGELLLKLNELFHTPKATFRIERKKTEVNLNFRHFLIFSYLTEDIIATMNTYFDTQFFGSKLDFDYFLDDFIKIALGIEDAVQDELKKKYSEEKKKVEVEYKKREEYAKKKKAYENTLLRLKDKFVSLGLGEDSFFNDADTMLRIIKLGLQKFEQYSDNNKIMKDLDELTKKRKTLLAQIAQYNSLKREYERYQTLSQDQGDSLIPLDFLNKHIEEVLDYEDTKLLVLSLRDSLQEIKETSLQKVELPVNFEQHYKELTVQRQAIDAKISQMDRLSKNAGSVRWMHEVVKLRVEFENLKEPKFKGLTDSAYINLQDEVNALNDQISRFISNKVDVENGLDEAINKYYNSQIGISASYNSCRPHFNIEERMLMLKSSNSRFYKRNVGSKSNYMFMHLCFFLGLHDFLLQQDNAFVPNFLFIDQPSIPYYADKSKHDENTQNDDEKKLRDAFNLMNRFMDTIVGFQKHDFQIIMIEHADSKYWDDFKYFETKYVFTEDKDFGLIPEILARKS